MKFSVGDTVVGNALNHHGITGEDCVVVVTKTHANTFDGIVQDHPYDEDYEGSNQTGLRYEWFDIEEDDNPLKRYTVGQRLQVSSSKLISHYDDDTIAYRGQQCRVIEYDKYDEWEEQWRLTVMFDNGHIAEVYECEMMLVPQATYVAPAPAYTRTTYPAPNPVTVREEETPKDVKSWGRVREEIVITPAHKPKESTYSSMLSRLETKGKEFNSTRRRRNQQLSTQPEVKLKA